MPRPKKYPTEESLLNKAAEYFGKCDKEKLMPSKAGLRVFLNIDKSTYSDYKKLYPNPIKRSEDLIEEAWVQRLNGVAATGAIFYLKNAFFEDYRDRVETDITSGGKPLFLPSEVINKYHLNGTDALPKNNSK